MSTQWSTRGISKADSNGELTSKLSADEVVILMQGKNTFGDRIYSYLKVTIPDLKRMQSAVLTGQPFNPSDFGSVVAAGKGEPTDEIKAEVSSQYRILDAGRQSAPAPVAPPTQSKAWDEY